MSANGEFSSTLDYQFFGGGVLRVSGGVSTTIDPSLVSFAQVPIFAESTNNSIDFSLTSLITAPIIYSSTDVTIDFDSSSFVEFGKISNASVGWKVLQVPFSANAEGYLPVAGSLNQTLDFNLDTNIYIWSDADGSGSFNFSLLSKATNVSTHVYSQDGATFCSLNENSFNNVTIHAQSNAVEILDNGERLAEIITAFNK